jgi:hypothetical protein
VVVGLLAVAWFVTARVGNGDALAQGGDSASTLVTTPTSSKASRRAVQCRDQAGSTVTTRCSVDGIDVEYRRVAGRSLESEYRAAIESGLIAGHATAGPAVCARGGEEERAWSRPAAPGRAVGRYACRVEQGRAAMWWTVDDRGLLVHAIASNADLGSLFAWWEAHSER